MADVSDFRDVETDSRLYANRETPAHIRDPKQKYCVLAVVAPEGTSCKSKDLMIQVFGTKKSKKEAQAWSDRIHADNPYFDVFILDTCAFAALPPDIGKIADLKTNNVRVQQILDEHKAEQLQSKQQMIDRIDAIHQQKEEESMLIEDNVPPAVQTFEQMEANDENDDVLERIGKSREQNGMTVESVESVFGVEESKKSD